MRKYFLLLLFIFLWACNINAEAFDDILINPDVAARGNSFTGKADSSSGIIYNPAGLFYVKQYTVDFNYSDLYGIGSVDYYNMSLIVPSLWQGSAGFCWQHQVLNDSLPIKEYIQDKFYLAYGCRLLDMLLLGASFKYYTARYDFNKTGLFSSDLGLLLNFSGNFRAGLLFKDFYSPAFTWYPGEREILDKKLRSGIVFFILEELNISYDNEDLLSDRNEQKDFLGLEFLAFNKRLALRTGLMNLYLKKYSITAGAAYIYQYLEFKYAFISHYDLGFSSIFGASAGF